MRRIAIFLAAVILICFQNCGFSGFVISEESLSTDAGRLSNDDSSTTDISTVPQGKIVHFDIPAQLVSLRISVIDLSQNQILGYSALLGKIIAFNSDGASYQEVSIPEPQLKKVLSVSPYIKYSHSSAGRYLYSNPGSLVSYEDLQKIKRFGILQTKDRSWARLDFSADCAPSVRSLPSAEQNVAYCVNSKSGGFFYQKIDSSGKPSGNIIQASQVFETSGSIFLGNDIWVNQLWTKKLVLSTGVVSDLPASFTSVPMPGYYFSVFRPEKNAILYVSYDQLGLKERNLATGNEKNLLNSRYQYQIYVLDENTFIIRDQDTQERYIISGTAASAVSPLSSSIMGLAMSSTHLAFFTPDPTSTSVRVDVKLYDLKTLAVTSLCTPSMPSSSDFFGVTIANSNSNSNLYFAGSIGSDPNSYGMGMSFAMDRTCTDLYMAAIFRSQGQDPKYTRTLYKYGVKSMLTRILLNDTISSDGMGYFGNLLAIDNGTLYFTLARGKEVYATNSSGSLVTMLYGTQYNQYSEDAEVTNWNYSIFRVQYKNGDRGYLMPLDDTGVVAFKLPRVNGTPPSQFITNGGDNYLLLVRESDSDTVSADAFSIQFYNAKNEMVKKEKFFINQKDSSISNISSLGRYNTQNPYVVFKMFSYVVGKLKYVFVIANLQSQTVSIIDPPADVEFGWDTYVYPDLDLILSVRAACSISRKQCASDPFGPSTSSDSVSLAKNINGYYYFQLYMASKSSFRRYNYNGNLGFNGMVEIATYGGLFSEDGRSMVKLDYETRKATLYNLSAGTKQELATTLDSIWYVKNGLMGYVKEPDETYSSWYIDLITLKAEKLSELSGNKTPYSQMYSSLSESTFNNLSSDTVVMTGQNNVIFFNLTTKKIVKTIEMIYANVVWESGGQIVFGQTSAASYFLSNVDFKYKMTLVDFKTLEEKEINISAYETLICQSVLTQQTYCIGKRSGTHYLMKYNPSKLGFDDVAELNSEFNFGNLVILNKSLSLFTFSAVNYMERYMMIGRTQTAYLGKGWEGYLYKQ